MSENMVPERNVARALIGGAIIALFLLVWGTVFGYMVSGVWARWLQQGGVVALLLTPLLRALVGRLKF